MEFGEVFPELAGDLSIISYDFYYSRYVKLPSFMTLPHGPDSMLRDLILIVVLPLLVNLIPSNRWLQRVSGA